MGNRTDNLKLIDKLRDSAGSLKINTPDDDSPISEMVSTGDRLLAIKGKGIYEIKLADQVDPERTNIATPNTIQQVIPYGTDSSWVGAIILTAYHLFQSSCFPKEIDGTAAFILILEIAEDIAGANTLKDKFNDAEAAEKERLKPEVQEDLSFVMPAVGNVESRCNEFLQRADHVLQKLFRLVQMFYPDIRSGAWDVLKEKIDAELEEIDNFSQFLAEVMPFLHLIRNTRNCVEHPRMEQRLIVTDFSLDSESVLHPPKIDIIHPRITYEESYIRLFFEQSFINLINTVELMMAFLCNRRVESFTGLAVQVMELPVEHRKSKHTRYGYGTMFGNQIVPFG